MNSSYLIEMTEVTKRFGNTVANNEVSLRISPNSIHAVVGENGAGKSTAMNILYGLYSPDSGKLYIKGQQVTLQSPLDAIKHGLGMVHQHFTLVPTLSVTENIILGAEPLSKIGIDYSQARKKVQEISEQYGLRVNPDAIVQNLNVGEQQRIEILKVLYREADIIILDEPTAVLTPLEVEKFFDILRALKNQGKTIIIITHKLSEVLAISDNVTVMRDGKIVCNVITSETTAAELARLMVGRDVLLNISKDKPNIGEKILEISNLKYTNSNGVNALKNINLQICAGEIVGIAGVEGNGQTELIEIIAGILQPTSGSILFKQQEIAGKSPKYIRSLGIGHIPEDRHKRGLVLDFNLAENLILGTHCNKPAAQGPWLNGKYISQHATQLIQDFDVRPADNQLLARSLSGGNQQKLILSREFDLSPKLLLVSQPTRGVDIGAIEFIHHKLISLRNRGVAILLISAELEEVVLLSDRLLVIYEGAIVDTVDPTKVSQQQLGLMMTGAKIAN